MAVSGQYFNTYYLGLPPDSEQPSLYLSAAMEELKRAGVKVMQNNSLYDLAVYAIAAFYYDNRGLMTENPNSPGVMEAAQRMKNSFVLQLRGVTDDTEGDTEDDAEGGTEGGA